MNEVEYKGKLIRISPKNNNIIQVFENGEWKDAYNEPTFRSFSSLKIEGLRLYAECNRGTVFSTNYGFSWHLE